MTNKDTSIRVAFQTAQSSLGKAIKNAKNPFLGNNYADLESIQQAVYPSFHANGFMFMHKANADEHGEYVETLLIHVPSGEQYETRVYMHKIGDMQSVGSAITYARRYGIMMLTGIPVGDDDGNAAVGLSAMQIKLTKQAKGLEKFLSMPQEYETLKARASDADRIILKLKDFDEKLSIRLDTLWAKAEQEAEIK